MGNLRGKERGACISVSHACWCFEVMQVCCRASRLNGWLSYLPHYEISYCTLVCLCYTKNDQTPSLCSMNQLQMSQASFSKSEECAPRRTQRLTQNSSPYIHLPLRRTIPTLRPITPLYAKAISLSPVKYRSNNNQRQDKQQQNGHTDADEPSQLVFPLRLVLCCSF